MNLGFTNGHKWWRPGDPFRFNMNDGTPIIHCRTCGVVRRGDGKNKPCSGKTPRVTTRATSAAP